MRNRSNYVLVLPDSRSSLRERLRKGHHIQGDTAPVPGRKTILRNTARVFAVAALLLTLPATFADNEKPLEGSHKLAEDLFVRRLSPGVWLHVSLSSDQGAGPVAANGLLVTTGELSVMVDTGWTPRQARQLLDWAADTLGQPVEHVILTHSHADRAGGLPALRDRDVIIHGHAGTAKRTLSGGQGIVDWTFEFEERVELGGETVELFYPGPGHAEDNIVVWLPRRGVLFAVCLVKSASAQDLGYRGDADLARWPLAVRRVIEHYRDAAVVVPGHGKPRGVELLSHTMELLERASHSSTAP